MVVESQVKGARSAGRFSLALTVEDDDAGEAVSATWEVSPVVPSGDSRKAEARAKEAQDDDTRLLAFVDELAARGEVDRSRRAIRTDDRCPLPDKRARAAFERLIDSGRLAVDGSRVRPSGRRSGGGS
jgi:hypothetical protein